jgi:DNA-dependent RNA polymerase auxiliary subunit epsilon
MNKDYEITNISNYKKKMNFEEYKQIIAIYENILNEFICYSINTIFFQKKDLLLFIIKRGIETIKHCFIQLYIYTKNINLVMFHCKKAFYYYIEFIGQITDDSHSYLQLTSKDAILFVYKKTIFDIDNSYRKNFKLQEQEIEFIDKLSDTINAYNRITIQYLYIKYKDENINKKNLLNDFFKKSKPIFKLLKTDNFKKINNSFLIFENFIRIYKFDIDKYLLLCNYLIKKSSKKYFNKNKLLDKNCDVYIKKYSELKFINWLLE